MDTNYEPQDESLEVAGFIAKTFEILNVLYILFRIKNFQESFIGQLPDLNSSSRTSTSFSKLFSPNTSDITRSTPSSGNLTCTASTSREKNTQKASSVTPCSLKIESKNLFYFRDLLCEIKRKIKQNEEEEVEKFETPVKSQKVMKEDLETAVTGKELPESREKFIESLKKLNLLENVGSSFIKLFESKENFYSKQHLNFSLNKISANRIG